MRNQILLVAMCGLMTSACANQWRDGDAGVSAEEVLSMLGEVSSAQASSATGSDLTGALALKDQAGVRIYFAQSKNQKDAQQRNIDPMGPVASILSLTNFEFLGRPGVSWAGLTVEGIQEARVFFLDVPNADGTHSAGLIVGMRKAEEQALTYAGFTGSGSMGDSEFTVTFPGKLVLRTNDVESGDLSGVIQMLVWDLDENGNEYYNGKFSTLIGFGD